MKTELFANVTYLVVMMSVIAWVFVGLETAFKKMEER